MILQIKFDLFTIIYVKSVLVEHQIKDDSADEKEAACRKQRGAQTEEIIYPSDKRTAYREEEPTDQIFDGQNGSASLWSGNPVDIILENRVAEAAYIVEQQ